jgi:hypothetical protein
MPHRKKISNEIEKVYASLIDNLTSALENAHRISFCTDIWTKAGISGSFLGVTAHFFTIHSKQQHQVTLAVQ